MDRTECIAVLKELKCPEQVVRHSEAVAGLARAIAAHIPDCNAETVYTGGMLHDIGRTVTNSLSHAYEGEKIAVRLGLPPSVREIIRTHMGGGITEEEAALLGLPENDCVPHSLESKVVCHADNLIADTKRRSLRDVLKQYRDKGLDTAAERIQKLHDELSQLAGVDLDTVTE